MIRPRPPLAPLCALVCALLCAAPAAANPAPGLFKPKLRLCTGTPGNSYHRVGQKLAAAAGEGLQVEVITTLGSWENLDRLADRQCDAIIAQEDAYALRHFEAQAGEPPPAAPTPGEPAKPRTPEMHRTATLYPEHVHLLCNAAVAAQSIASLDPATVIYIHRYGSGSYISWKLFGTLNPAYEALTTVEVPLTEALPRLARDARPACLFMVSGLGGRTLTAANDTFGDALRLLPVIDRKLHKPMGRARRQIYAPSTITARTWPRLLDADLSTQTVDAVFFTHPEWMARHPDAAKRLQAALVELIPKLD